MRTALLIIDVQNDYFPGGTCELFQPEQALMAIQSLLRHFRKQALPVFYVQHISDAGAAFFLPGTPGAAIRQAISPLDTETVVVKHAPNSFYETDLHELLKEADVTDLVVCGMMTHMCIDTTVRAAKDLGYRVTLLADACATKALQWNGTAVSAEAVQRVYCASLHPRFATVQESADYLQQ